MNYLGTSHRPMATGPNANGVGGNSLVLQYLFNREDLPFQTGAGSSVSAVQIADKSGNDLHGDVNVFPNPVRPGYKGPITITGLPENATVKITDIAGRVVYEMIANGGTAVWDGNNFNGERAQTGIYLFITANDEDKDPRVTKLLLVN